MIEFILGCVTGGVVMSLRRSRGDKSDLDDDYFDYDSSM